VHLQAATGQSSATSDRRLANDDVAVRLVIYEARKAASVLQTRCQCTNVYPLAATKTIKPGPFFDQPASRCAKSFHTSPHLQVHSLQVPVIPSSPGLPFNMAPKALVPLLVTMMLVTGVCNTLLTKYQVSTVL
jgi:hypothetical protein